MPELKLLNLIHETRNAPEIDSNVWEALLRRRSVMHSTSKHVCRRNRHKWTSLIKRFMPNICHAKILKNKACGTV